MNAKWIAAAFVSIAMLNGAKAQVVYVGGEGIVECGAYLKLRQENRDTQNYVFATWVRGFLSGWNFATSGKATRSIPSTETILAYLDNHCRAKPLEHLVNGATALAEELGATRVLDRKPESSKSGIAK